MTRTQDFIKRQHSPVIYSPCLKLHIRGLRSFTSVTHFLKFAGFFLLAALSGVQSRPNAALGRSNLFQQIFHSPQPLTGTHPRGFAHLRPLSSSNYLEYIFIKPNSL